MIELPKKTNVFQPLELSKKNKLTEQEFKKLKLCRI